MIAYVSLHACCPSQITHFKSSFESSNSGVKMPYPGSFPRLFFFLNKLRLSTRWNNISVFYSYCGVGCCSAPRSSLSLCCCVHRLILRKSSVTAQQVLYGYRKRCVQFHSISRYHWARLKNLFGFQSHMKKIFQAANQNKNNFCCLLLSLSHTDHIDRSWKLDWSKKRNECSVFHSVLGLYTNDFLDLLLLYFL